MKITLKVYFLFGSGTQGKGKLKRGYIRENNFLSGTEENTTFFRDREGIFANMLAHQFAIFWTKFGYYYNYYVTIWINKFELSLENI
jgi:hypothetical protein